MRLTRLAVRDWRNLHHAALGSDARFVVLHGDNAQGKTNLIEAVWMLATLRSFREAKPGRLVREGAHRARIDGTAVGHTGTRGMRWSLQQGTRKLRLDGAAPSSLSSWFEAVRAVLFCPEHVSIIRGGPDQRRTFLDRAAFTAQPAYLDVARDYRRAVRQKAALLKSPGTTSAQIAPWSDRIVDLGARVVMARYRVMTQLRDPLRDLYTAIAGTGRGAAEVELSLRSLGGEEDGLQAVRERLRSAVESHQQDEQRRGRVLVGPHRDDLVIRLEGRSARAFASQGQARSLVLALKLAELAAAHARGQAPMLLLDDLTSELDRGRMGRLVDILAGLDNQVWLSTTDPSWLGPLPSGEALRWRVEAGQVFGEGSTNIAGR
ncbi:MAG: DNA replication and repair protein RecF [Oligoflexia bacterium]|nr:DNA replication and repair protein RecF [Oligoflexia bacterium]